MAHGSTEEAEARQVEQLVHVDAPWGIRVEVAHGLAEADHPFASPLVAGGFVTDSVGFGHVVFDTTASDESHRFVTDVRTILNMAQDGRLTASRIPGSRKFLFPLEDVIRVLEDNLNVSAKGSTTKG